MQRTKLQTLNSYMNRSNLNFDLQIKIRKYLGYVWSKNLEEEKKAQEILNELPNSLREEILINSQARFLRGHTIFTKFFSEETLCRLATRIKPIHFSAEDWIFLVLLSLYQNNEFKFKFIINIVI